MFKPLWAAVACVILANSQATAANTSSEFIIWNVGQGLWVTEVHPRFCLHYDMGGEINVGRKVLKLCQGKENRIHLSHWDWDHISFAAFYTRKSHSACLISKPLGRSSAYKEKILSAIPLCKPYPNEKNYRTLFNGKTGRNSNDGSSVVYSRQFHVLIPGDSPKSMEKNWREYAPSNIEGLILGHHGSRTSTSRDLLEHLPNLRWTVASARERRYGHPHAQVRKLLREHRLPLLRTEDWGHLHFLKSP